MLTEEEILSNFERTTDQIMEIFDDPVFSNDGRTMDLEEIDF
jgi:hypothetical protein